MGKKQSKSNRRDGRGGWVAGKRRNPDCGDWSRIRINLAALINEHYRHGRISGRALAIAIGVSSRAVGRWLRGEDRPSLASQELVRQWLADRRAELSPRK